MRSVKNKGVVVSGLAIAALSGLIAGRAAADCGAGPQGIAANVSAASLVSWAGVNALGADYDQAGKHDCKGQNDCKGQGGCSSGDNGCKGQNSCKGKGGCNTSEE